MPFIFKGRTFPQVAIGDMSPGEIAQVESITGWSYPKLARHAKSCVCEHLVDAHFHFHEGKPTDDLSCTAEGCGCAGFAADQPVLATFAYMWIALKRANPEVTFQEIEDTPQSEWRYETATDPTPPPPPSTEE